MLLYNLLIKKEKFVNRATVLSNIEFTQATRGFWYRASRHASFFPFILVVGITMFLQTLISIFYNEKINLVPPFALLFNNYQIFGSLTTLDADFVLPLAFIIVGLSGWSTQIFIEADLMRYTCTENLSLRQGFFVFLITEIVFFFGLFWAYFHLSLNPSPELGAVWPHFSIPTWTLLGFPLANTFSLLYSGSWATETTIRLHFRAYQHEGDLNLGSQFVEIILPINSSLVHIFAPADSVLDRRFTIEVVDASKVIVTALRQNYIYEALNFGILAGLPFSFGQIIEIYSSPLSLTLGGAFSSALYFIVNFHGFHVNLNGAMIAVLQFRLSRNLVVNPQVGGTVVTTTALDHILAETALWYWHFVDIVWIAIISVLYIWGA